MKISVEEILSDNSKIRFTILFGNDPVLHQKIAAEIIEYKAVDSLDYTTVFPKASRIDNEEKFAMRGRFQESFVNKENDFVFDISISKLFRLRYEAWLKAETIAESTQ